MYKITETIHDTPKIMPNSFPEKTLVLKLMHKIHYSVS